MIEVNESWDSIGSRIGIKPWRRGRGSCPFCESRTGFSVHERKGFNCFACGRHGDKIAFVQQYQDCDFSDTLRFFGLEPGKPPVPDPAVERRQKIHRGLNGWTRIKGRDFRNEIYAREFVITRARRRLQEDPEDDWLWWALTGYDSIENRHDAILSKESQRIELYKKLRLAP